MEHGVTVICITYNHAAYIQDALESFVNQNVSFPYKVLVGDDASTDGTADIVRDYAERYPDIIVPVLREQNISAGKNWQDLISRANTTYLAFCDGDDYWCDDCKIQIQFEYMERFKDLRACFHDTRISVETADGTWFQLDDFNNTDDGVPHWPSGHKRFVKKDCYSLVDYIPFGFVHTSSMFIRWDYAVSCPDWILGHGFSDYPLWALQVGRGEFGYIDRVMSVYRKVEGSAFCFRDRQEFWRKSKEGWIPVLEGLREAFDQPQDASLRKALLKREREEVSKLIRGSMATESPEETWSLLDCYRDTIWSLYHIPISKRFSNRAFERDAWMLKTFVPFPPYRTHPFRKVVQCIRNGGFR